MIEVESKEASLVSVHHCPHCGFQLKQFEQASYGNVIIESPGRIRFRSEVIDLPPSQFLIADALIRARGRGLSRTALANLLSPELGDNSIVKYVARLRSAFRRVEPAFDQIESLWGFSAYRWVMEPAKGDGGLVGLNRSIRNDLPPYA
jgi:hypothetical protein